MKTTFKTLSFLLLFLMFISIFSPVLASENPVVTVFVDGEQVEFDVNPIIENGRTLVPMRFIFEALAAEVDWISETSTAIAVKGDTKIEITIGENKLVKNGEEIELDVPAKLIDGRTLVPVRAVSEGLDATVEWDAELYKVIITSNDEKTYAIDELSPEDLKTFKEVCADFRYEFEQNIIPAASIPYPENVIADIKNKETEMLDELYFYWDYYLYQFAMSIQIESESTYNFPEDADTDTLIKAYQALIEKHGLDAKSTFKASFETTPGKKDILVLTFSNVKSDDPLMITCKYIALVPVGDAIRCFTLEYSPISSELMGKDTYMFCEITETGRGTYFSADADEKSFFEAIDKVIDDKLKLAASQTKGE